MVAGREAGALKPVDGVPAWPAPKTYDSPYRSGDSATKMALGPGNTIYTAGMSIGANGLPDIPMRKWSSSGNVQWARRYDGPTHDGDRPMAVVVDSAGNVTVADVSVNGTNMDWVVVSWSASGVKLWASRYGAGAPHQMMPTDLVVAADRSIYATGRAAAV